MILDSGVGDIANSPFIVPVAGCFMIAAIVIAGNISGTRKREIESQERLAAIAKGIAPPATREELAITQAPAVSNANRRHANIRLAGIILCCGGVATMLFFFALTIILRQREILSGAACGLIPLGLGVGFLIDARAQARAIAEHGASLPL